MSSEAERYAELGLADALRRPYDYSSACIELSFLLRRAYSKLPKNLQSVLFQDTLDAFRILAEQPVRGASAANLLNQAAEASLPKQKKALATSEYKHAVVAHKRRSKFNLDHEGVASLPHDVLVQIFNLLDLRSLVMAGSVCKSWKSAASDDILWKYQYSIFFGNIDEQNEINERHVNRKVLPVPQNRENTSVLVNRSWRESFIKKHIGSSWSLLSSIIYCRNCRSVIWLSSVTPKSFHSCFLVAKQSINIKQLTPSKVHRVCVPEKTPEILSSGTRCIKVAEYLLGEVVTLSESSSDSDSDSDEIWPYGDRLSKLWALPKDIGTSQRFIA